MLGTLGINKMDEFPEKVQRSFPIWRNIVAIFCILNWKVFVCEIDFFIVFGSLFSYFLLNYWWLCHRIFLAKEICPFHSLCMELSLKEPPLMEVLAQKHFLFVMITFLLNSLTLSSYNDSCKFLPWTLLWSQVVEDTNIIFRKVWFSYTCYLYSYTYLWAYEDMFLVKNRFIPVSTQISQTLPHWHINDA